MTLDQNAISAALDILNSEYPDELPLTTLQTDMWRDVLGKLEPGELRPALSAYGRVFRPGPLEVLGIVQEARRTDTRPARARTPDIVRETIEQARRDLNRTPSADR